MDLTKKAMLEGVLFGSAHPVKANLLEELLGFESEELKNLIGELQEEYAQSERGIWLVMVAGGYQLRTKPELKEVMARLYEKKPPRLSSAMLETLAIVAYKQPATRPEIDRIRGVDSTGAIKTLLERELIEMRGRSDSVGNPVLYATTQKFLEWFQIDNLKNLPPLSEIDALQSVSDEASENLLHLLSKDEGFTAEDLKDLDETLLDVARSHRRINFDAPVEDQSDISNENTQLESSVSEIDINTVAALDALENTKVLDSSDSQ